jgi:hypothetical protein
MHIDCRAAGMLPSQPCPLALATLQTLKAEIMMKEQTIKNQPRSDARATAVTETRERLAGAVTLSTA